MQAFEKGSRIGGQWAYEAEAAPGVHSSVYDGLIMNSCRDTSAFSDFPLDPARYPDYFSHRAQLGYLNEYADHFGLKQHVRFRTRVVKCEPRAGGGWTVQVQEEGGPVEQLGFDAIFCATGSLTDPVVPDFEGRDRFRGDFVHSHYYRRPAKYEGKRVAIIGLGSSAVDIACEVGPHAKELHVITRRGVWVLPRYLLGKPVEAWAGEWFCCCCCCRCCRCCCRWCYAKRRRAWRRTRKSTDTSRRSCHRGLGPRPRSASTCRRSSSTRCWAGRPRS